MLELKPAWAHQMASQDLCVRSFPESDACARQVKPPGWHSFLVVCGQASLSMLVQLWGAYSRAGGHRHAGGGPVSCCSLRESPPADEPGWARLCTCTGAPLPGLMGLPPPALAWASWQEHSALHLKGQVQLTALETGPQEGQLGAEGLQAQGLFAPVSCAPVSSQASAGKQVMWAVQELLLLVDAVCPAGAYTLLRVGAAEPGSPSQWLLRASCPAPPWLLHASCPAHPSRSSCPEPPSGALCMGKGAVGCTQHNSQVLSAWARWASSCTQHISLGRDTPPRRT